MEGVTAMRRREGEGRTLKLSGIGLGGGLVRPGAKPNSALLKTATRPSPIANLRTTVLVTLLSTVDTVLSPRD
ncbi:hypothetical protein VTN77DRAFT_2997 [Rasamsonia byssochlamydoides]|uniref:uncharacterized protein n=1 Tax=Rasamsonia byssochlamydoides TaxID=89139 RepID=UPI0037420414